MGIELLLNDYYDLLRLLQRNEAIILDEKVIPLTQMQIAKSMGLSKMKINSMFKFLQDEKFIEQKNRGKYILTDKAVGILDIIEVGKSK